MDEAFCRAPMPFGLGDELDAINAIIDERKSAEARAQQPKFHANNRGPHTYEDASSICDDGTFTTQGSNSADYLTARIARD